MHNCLVKKLFKPEMIGDMLEESEDSVLSREECVTVIRLMDEAIVVRCVKLLNCAVNVNAN
jgi:hypothetical protein